MSDQHTTRQQQDESNDIREKLLMGEIYLAWNQCNELVIVEQHEICSFYSSIGVGKVGATMRAC